MVKLYLLLFFLFLYSFSSRGQTVEVFENFSTYDGTVLTVPSQWTFSDQGVFTDTLYSGKTGPNAFKFMTDSTTITSPYFDASDSVSFYLKDASNTISSSVLIVLATADSIKWDTLSKITTLPLHGTRFAFKLVNNMHQLKFVFLKISQDSLAFDDFYITRRSSATADFFGKTVCYGDTTFFQDWSTSLLAGGTVIQWRWKFDDGSIDSAQHPYHIYAKAGTYSVQLKIKNSRGDSDSITKFNVVFPRPSETFTFAAPGPCSARCMQFSDKSSITGGGADEDQAIVTTWLWNIGGTSYSTPAPLHCFDQPGTYSVSLTATADNGCVGHTEKSTIVIPSGPMAAFAYVMSDKRKYLFTASIYNDTNSVTYKWMFGDGDSSSLKAPIHSFNTDGDYSVCLTATGPNGCDSLCHTIKVASIMGVEDNFSPSVFLIYPNPAGEKLNIQSTEQGLISIFNVLGRLVIQKQTTASATEVDVSYLPDGNYFLQLKTKSTTLSKRFNLIH